MLFPQPLRPGDTIGVTAPSSGVDHRMWPRFEIALQALRDQGYDVRIGECLDGAGHLSAPKEQRAAELMSMLLDPGVHVVFPPWGGETSADLLDVLDWEALARAEPTWVVGYSDSSTWITPLTLRLGWATIHGQMLMDEPTRRPDGIARWSDLARRDGPVTQHPPGAFRSAVHDDFTGDPGFSEWTLDAPGTWSTLDGASVDATGRLVGGCLETLAHLAGTPYGDVPGWSAQQQEGSIVYLEASDDDAFEVCRVLHGLRYAGWFDRANAVLIARTLAPDGSSLTQRGAVVDALGMLDVPVVLDVECGHTAPGMALVNGALARVVVDGERREITQELR
jgi:muramoyltetrapeptide carboxypeptidase